MKAALARPRECNRALIIKIRRDEQVPAGRCTISATLWLCMCGGARLLSVVTAVLRHKRISAPLMFDNVEKYVLCMS